MKAHPVNSNDWLIVLQFLLIAFTNLTLFSWMDYEYDLKDRHRSLVTLTGKGKVKILLWILFGIFLLFNFLTFKTNQKSSIILLAMELILFLIFLSPAYFKKEERFRYTGDAIFFLPAIIFVI
jgi:4-hydroxybenzoate polyprenyltransferase